MPNSISLSSDMTKLFFNDLSGLTTIDLSGNGALLQIVSGELVATAASDPLSGSGVVESTTNNQWTLFYNDAVEIVFFVGIEDVDSNMTDKSHHFELAGQKVNVRKSGTTIIVVSQKI